MAEFVNYSVALVMIALFSIALITFAVNFGIDNDANINIGDDSGFSDVNTSLRSNLDEFHTGTGTSSTSFSESTISSQTEASEGGTQFKVTPWTSLAMATNSITTSWNRIFGQGSGFAIILTSLITVLTFIIGMYAYKGWVGRSP